MAIGKRIRFFRTLKNLTQKELGLKLRYPERVADVRVAQYESETRVPKEDTIERLSYIFDVSPNALKVPDIDSDIGFMHTLFVLEDTRYLHITQTESGQYCITLDRYVENQKAFDMNELFRLWHDEYQKFLNGEITKEEYDHWRYTYPRVEADRFQERLKKLREKKITNLSYRHRKIPLKTLSFSGGYFL